MERKKVTSSMYIQRRVKGQPFLFCALDRVPLLTFSQQHVTKWNDFVQYCSCLFTSPLPPNPTHSHNTESTRPLFWISIQIVGKQIHTMWKRKGLNTHTHYLTVECIHSHFSFFASIPPLNRVPLLLLPLFLTKTDAPWPLRQHLGKATRQRGHNFVMCV